MTPRPEDQHTLKGAFPAALMWVLCLFVLYYVLGPALFAWLFINVLFFGVIGLLLYVILRDLVFWPWIERAQQKRLRKD